jgi:CBS domain-containing protein
MLVKDVMVPVVGTAQPDDLIRDAQEKIRALALDPLPVCEDSVLTGVLWERDVLAEAQLSGLTTGTKQVREVMSPVVVAVGANMTVDDALDELQADPEAAGMGRVPVVNGDGHVVGMGDRAALRRRHADEDDGVTAVDPVTAIDEIRKFDQDPVTYMSDASFPASDPPAPQSADAVGEE